MLKVEDFPSFAAHEQREPGCNQFWFSPGWPVLVTGIATSLPVRVLHVRIDQKTIAASKREADKLRLVDVQRLDDEPTSRVVLCRPRLVTPKQQLWVVLERNFQGVIFMLHDAHQRGLSAGQ